MHCQPSSMMTKRGGVPPVLSAVRPSLMPGQRDSRFHKCRCSLLPQTSCLRSSFTFALCPAHRNKRLYCYMRSAPLPMFTASAPTVQTGQTHACMDLQDAANLRRTHASKTHPRYTSQTHQQILAATWPRAACHCLHQGENSDTASVGPAAADAARAGLSGEHVAHASCCRAWTVSQLPDKRAASATAASTRANGSHPAAMSNAQSQCAATTPSSPLSMRNRSRLGPSLRLPGPP